MVLPTIRIRETPHSHPMIFGENTSQVKKISDSKTKLPEITRIDSLSAHPMSYENHTKTFHTYSKNTSDYSEVNYLKSHIRDIGRNIQKNKQNIKQIAMNMNHYNKDDENMITLIKMVKDLQFEYDTYMKRLKHRLYYNERMAEI